MLPPERGKGPPNTAKSHLLPTPDADPDASSPPPSSWEEDSVWGAHHGFPDRLTGVVCHDQTGHADCLGNHPSLGIKRGAHT